MKKECRRCHKEKDITEFQKFGYKKWLNDISSEK
jgi:uncharacterized protein YggL (DUF469 family)